MLTHDKETKASPCKYEAAPVQRQAVKIVGPNKRQELMAATASIDPSLGHEWYISAPRPTNLCIKCKHCSPFAQQCDTADVVAFVLSHPCKDYPATLGPKSGVHQSHKIINRGSKWSCSLCSAWARGRLVKECQGPPKAKVKPPSNKKPQSLGACAENQGFHNLFRRSPNQQSASQPKDNDEGQQPPADRSWAQARYRAGRRPYQSRVPAQP